MKPRALLRSGLIFTGTAVGLTAVIYHFAAPLLDFLLPLYRAELQLLMPSFHIDSLTWLLDRGETMVALTATLANYNIVLGRMIPPRGIDQCLHPGRPCLHASGADLCACG